MTTIMENLPMSAEEFNELCRLCAAKTNVLVGLSIFEDEGDNRQIYKKIRACLPVQVTIADRLPKMVCEECVYKLDLLFEFRERSLRTEHYLETVLARVMGVGQVSQPSSQTLTSTIPAPNEQQVQVAPVATATLTLTAPVLLVGPLPVPRPPSFSPEPVAPSAVQGAAHTVPPQSCVTGHTHVSRPVLTLPPHTQPEVQEQSAQTNTEQQQYRGSQPPQLQITTSDDISEVQENGDDCWMKGVPQQRQDVQCEPDLFIKVENNELDTKCGNNDSEDDENNAKNWNNNKESIRIGNKVSKDACHKDKLSAADASCMPVTTNETNLVTSVGSLRHDGGASLLTDDNREKTSTAPSSKSSNHIGSQVPEEIPKSVWTDKPADDETGEQTEEDTGSADRPCSRRKWEPKVCKECGKEYRTNYKLREHMRRHTGERPFRCSSCPKAFRSKIGLAQHEARHTGEFEFSCDSCGKGFQCKSYLIVHQRVHSEDKPYVCGTCGRCFKMRQSLLDHQNRHLGIKPYSCETCGRRFVTKGLCKSHQRVHSGTDNRRHPCAVCGKLFVSKSYLATHLRIHTGEKPFMCEVCGKAFLTRVDLRIHATVHTGEKSFQCEWCGKAFARRDALRCHRRSHTGERPYTCDVCGQSFTQFSPLTIHKRLHTGERPYSCEVCAKGFVSRSTMMAHRKKCTS